MKHHFYNVLFLGLITSLAYSCKKDENAPNEGPGLIDGKSTNLTFTHGKSETLNLADYFTDKEGDAWELSNFSSKDTAIVKVSVPKTKNDTRQSILIQAGKPGSTLIQLEFKDAKGQAVTAEFNISVVNEAPKWKSASAFNPGSVKIKAESEWAIADSIIDAEGDQWIIKTVKSSNENVVTVDFENPGNEVVAAPADKAVNALKQGQQTLAEARPRLYYFCPNAGTAKITLTVEDALGAQRDLSFDVTVSNEAPNWKATMATKTIYTNSSSSIDLSADISDAENHNWYISSVSSSNTSVVNCSLNPFGGIKMATSLAAKVEIPANKLFYYSTGTSTGNATITVVVADEYGATRTLSYSVSVATLPKETVK